MAESTAQRTTARVQEMERLTQLAARSAMRRAVIDLGREGVKLIVFVIVFLALYLAIDGRHLARTERDCLRSAEYFTTYADALALLTANPACSAYVTPSGVRP